MWQSAYEALSWVSIYASALAVALSDLILSLPLGKLSRVKMSLCLMPSKPGAQGWSFGGSLNLLDWFAKVCVCIYIYMFIYFKIGSVTFIKFSKGPSIQKRLRTSGLNNWKWSIIYLTFPGCFLALNERTTLLHALPRGLKRAWGRSSFASSSFPTPPPFLGPFLCHVFFL